MTFFSITLALFLIMDPFGNISTYLKLLEQIPPERKKSYVLREMVIAFILMVGVFIFSDFFFWFLQISDITVRLTSGLVLFLFALKVLFVTPTSPRRQLPPPGEEPFIIPLAVPLICGPALLATILLFSHLSTDHWMMFGAISLSWLAAIAVLWAGPFFHRLLGDNGLQAVEKLMGMILILLAIQRFMDGVRTFLEIYG